MNYIANRPENQTHCQRRAARGQVRSLRHPARGSQLCSARNGSNNVLPGCAVRSAPSPLPLRGSTRLPPLSCSHAAPAPSRFRSCRRVRVPSSSSVGCWYSFAVASTAESARRRNFFPAARGRDGLRIETKVTIPRHVDDVRAQSAIFIPTQFPLGPATSNAIPPTSACAQDWVYLCDYCLASSLAKPWIQ